jgi:hypothetical protein
MSTGARGGRASVRPSVAALLACVFISFSRHHQEEEEQEEIACFLLFLLANMEFN